MDQPTPQTLADDDAVGSTDAGDRMPLRLQAAPTRWVANRAVPTPAWPIPPLLTALRRGACGRCPACGHTDLFEGFLRVTPVCSRCTAPLGSYRADDAPPYFVVFIVAHLVIGVQLLLEQHAGLSMLAEAAILLPLTTLAALGLLRPVKGATLGWMLKIGLVKDDG